MLQKGILNKSVLLSFFIQSITVSSKTVSSTTAFNIVDNNKEMFLEQHIRVTYEGSRVTKDYN